MFGILLDGSSEEQSLIFSDTLGCTHSNDTVFPKRKRAGLVENHCVEQAGLFQTSAISNEEAIAGTDRRGDRDDQWDGEPECMRARDD
jgi:hypothetical protein